MAIVDAAFSTSFFLGAIWWFRRRPNGRITIPTVIGCLIFVALAFNFALGALFASGTSTLSRVDVGPLLEVENSAAPFPLKEIGLPEAP